jgi:hypothetical protein
MKYRESSFKRNKLAIKAGLLVYGLKRHSVMAKDLRSAQ